MNLKHASLMTMALLAVTLTGVAFTTAAALLLRGRAWASVMVGTTTAILNLLALRTLISFLVRSAMPASGDAEGRVGGWGIVVALKMLLLLVGSGMLLLAGVVRPLPFLLGYSSLLIGIALGAGLTVER